MDREKYVDVITNTDNTCQREGVIIPIARTATGELVNIELNNENGLTFISGRIGSGKSTIIRMILASVLSHIKDKPVEIFLADAKGYEFPELGNLSQEYLKEMLIGYDNTSFERFIHKIYLRLEEKRNKMAEKGWYNIETVPETEKLPISLIIIDDISMFFDYKKSYDMIYEFETLIREGWACGFRFVLLSQSYQIARERMPMIVQNMIGQKICISPYMGKDVIDFCEDYRPCDVEVQDNSERFSIIMKKRSTGQYETGKLFYINRDELGIVTENL